MDMFNNNLIESIVLCFGAQIGKTEAELNMIGFALHQSKAPVMMVYPTDTLAKFNSDKRVEPMIKNTEPLAEMYNENESSKLELNFNTGNYLVLSGANSPSSLASRAIKYVFFDEVDKYPVFSGKEANPIKLATERTKTFVDAKHVMVSTPTVENGNIWTAFKQAHAQKEYYVPCPHCGEYQKLVFKQIKWPDEAKGNKDRIRDTAYYECAHCKEAIHDKHKLDMLRNGEWRTENEPDCRVRSVGYHLSSLYSPWIAFGKVAYEFFTSKDFPDQLMNFINSWLAEPWEDKSSKLKSDVVMGKALPYERGRMPEEAQLLTCGIDVQLDHFYFSVRAWGAHMTSWLVDWGRVETWADLETVINRNYADMNGVVRNVNLACYNTDDVYTFCARHMDVLVPSKGSSLPMKSRYSVTILDKQAAGFGLRLYVMDTNQMKNFIASRMTIDAGAHGSWNVYKGIEREYADQICAEQRVEQKDKKGRVSVVWEKISSHAANHLLDCETNNALAAEIIGVRYLMEEEQENSSLEQEEKDNDWLGVGRQWI